MFVIESVHCHDLIRFSVIGSLSYYLLLYLTLFLQVEAAGTAFYEESSSHGHTNSVTRLPR